MKRRSLMLIEPKTVIWVEESLPALKTDEIHVRTIAGAISIGTELPIYQGIHRGSSPVVYPKMTGYESYAEVVACGANVQHMRVGQRIIAFYGHRTYAVLPAAKAIPVPRDVSPAVALLAILGCDTAKGVSKLPIDKDDPILIAGAGTIGLLTLFNLIQQGFMNVDVVEPLASRQKLARQLGARLTMHPNEIEAKREPYAAGIECSSQNQAFALLQKNMKHGGQICVLADGNLEPLILLPEFHEKELSIVGSSDGEDYFGYAEWFWDVAKAAAHDLEQLYQLKIPCSELVETFGQLADAGPNPIKVFVDYLTEG
ncbi:MAG: zinc-binding alcohol dehydrogenase [Anaerolineae bacterium]